MTAAAQSPTFGPPANYTAGSSPWSVAVGDYNGDGIADLAVANHSSDNISVLKGNSNGSFQAAVNYALNGTTPNGIVKEDFNRDGKLDLAVINSSSGTNGPVDVLLGNGDGTFQTPVSYGTLAGANAITTGDFNGDGLPDLIIGRGNTPISGTINILLGNGNGTFQPPGSIFTDDSLQRLAAGDFNRDGKLDLFGGMGHGEVDLFLGNGDGTFQSFSTLGGQSSSASALVLSDFNRDGKLDLAVGGNNAVTILLGSGDGHVQSSNSIPFSNVVTDLAVGDFNDDGKPDLAATGVFLHHNLDVLTGNGDGTFQSPVNLVDSTAGISVTTGDFNNDGKLDLEATVNGSVNVLLNTTTIKAGSFGPASTSAVGLNPYFTAPADFNRDGKLDLAVVNYNDNSSVSILIGNGIGGFITPAPTYPVGLQPTAIVVGDFNRDGKPDLALTHRGVYEVRVLIGNGDGTFITPAPAYAVGNRPVSIQTGDFNGDGKPDLITANESSNISLLKGNGDGTFQSAVTIQSGGMNTSSLAVGDFNRDGKLDFAETNYSGPTTQIGSVCVYLGNGDGTFADPIYLTDFSGSFVITTGDFNRDGKLDLAVTNFSGPHENTVGVLIGNGDGTFQSIVNYNVGQAPTEITVGDFNLDGSPDLAVANVSSSTISVLNGNGDGTFQPATNYSVAALPRGITAGDFNRDGKLDLAFTSNPNSIVSLWLNNLRFVTSVPSGFTVTEGASFTSNLMNFETNPGDSRTPSEFAATIDWNDGTTPSAGTITGGVGGSFGVSGTHTYAQAGTYKITVTIHDNLYNVDAAASNTITVTDAPLTATGKNFTAVWGKSFTGPVASFTDANPLAKASDFTADIAWGETSHSAGTIVANSNGGFDVIGTHTYHGVGAYAVRVSIMDVGGSSAGTNSTATVVAPLISINDATGHQDGNGSTNATFTVSLSTSTDQAITVDYATQNGTARAGEDYVAASGTLTFSPGQVSKTLTITVLPETDKEPDQTLLVNLSNPVNANLDTKKTGTGTIINSNTAGTLQFSASTYSVNEGAGSASITVSRTGAHPGTASVDYSVSDGTAHQRSDYTTTSGTLSFAPGELSKTFTVLVIDNAYVDGSRTVDLTLSNPVESALSAQSTAVLTITDNDTTPPTSNPIDSAQFFVQQHYYDFLNRFPDQGGLDYWSSQITQCGSDQNCINSRRIGVSAAYFIETEFQDTGSFVYRFYKASYGVRPTYAQFMPDRSRVVGGANLDAGKAAFAENWVTRPEFVQKYPSTLSGTQFIDALLQTVQQGSGVDLSAKRQSLIADYNTNQSRGRIVQLIAEDETLKAAEYNRAFVLMQYFGYLRRDPDQGGYDFWLDVLNNRVANNYRGMVCAFLTSAEYQDRFSPLITRNDSICSNVGP